MRQTQNALLLIALGIVSTPAVAIEITGGDLNLKYSQLDDKIFDTTLEAFSVDGGIELGFTKNFAAQFDLGYYDFGAINENGTTFTLHGIYHLNDDVSLGAFYGQDDIDVLDTDFYGVEAGYEAGNFEVEGYIGAAESEGEDATLFGVYGAYGVTQRVDITGAYETADDDDGSLDRYEVGVRFEPVPQVALTAGIGSAELDVFGESGSDTFFSVGLEYTFGAERGATFGRRGLLKLIPGL